MFEDKRLVWKFKHGNSDALRLIYEKYKNDLLALALALSNDKTTEERTVWIAHYDGRPLKPWEEVKAPVPNPQNVPFHPGMASGSGLSSMQDLFDDFVYYQNYDLTAKGLIIIDETGLPNDENTDNYEPEKYAVCNESIYWGGNKSIEIAKKWFNEQFGITFTEEQRQMPVWIVQEKQ